MDGEQTTSVTSVYTSTALPGLDPVVLVTFCLSDMHYLSAISNQLVHYSSG